MYFDIVFDVLVFSGTLEMKDLLSKCNVMEDFELINFITVYEDVFEIEEVDDVQLISIKLNINPFDINQMIL
ncbi:hypothetical protein NBO_3g0014 [Nosema bombycis CQ1]|uniref:Uncharacterized protein n=1 Tax=Nosema bombycis (strain CQ1 / CVCC 102059) TaxID=578461 RepID=R0MRE6_NOSB1|nr:hypothetical protein NBO_3g0014 [Nosema bombycis CQ1]|eukprot:EOB15463.1 hypothetical protein NBO_3g0014 [Nosema bombycis CQ1]